MVTKHPIFGMAEKFNIFALSQGALIARYIIEECNPSKIQVHNFVSVGAPMMGVDTAFICETWDVVCRCLSWVLVWLCINFKVVTKFFAPAEYIRTKHPQSAYDAYL